MHRKLTVILASVALLISLATIARRFRPAALPDYRAQYVSLGQVAAEEAIQAVAGRGQIVVVINEQFQLPKSALHDELASFQSELKKHGAVSLAATEVLPVDLTEMVIGNYCSSGQLQAILAKHANVAAIVFLIGLPEWDKLQAREIVLSPGTAKIIVVVDGAGTPKREYGGYFANGFLSVLIGVRSAPTDLANPKTPREWFDKYYQIFTPQNAATLPE